MRTPVLLSLLAAGVLSSGFLAGCASEPSPWADWESAPKTQGAAVAGSETGYKDYTPRADIESAPIDGTAPPPANAGDYDAASAYPAGTGAPTQLHAGPFAVESETPIAYTGKPVSQRTLPLALTGTGVAR